MNIWCAGKTGKEQRVQVSHSEGLANHTGPESCGGIREDAGEALTGERTGQPLSRESLIVPDADVVRFTEGNMGGAITRALPQSGVVEDPEHVRKLLAREPGGLGFGRRQQLRRAVRHFERFGKLRLDRAASRGEAREFLA